MEKMTELPLVSVVIPVYNGENYLREAIESVCAQSYRSIEIIVVDDGSTDQTWEIIQSYKDKVCGIHKENGGVASALNAGIRHARGELVAWLSHDDIFLPDKLARQVRFLAEYPAFGVCYTDFEIIDASGTHLATVQAPWFPAKDLPRSFLKDMHINGSTVMVRQWCFEKAGGFDERLAHTQDLEMWLRMAEITELGHLGEVLLKSRSHADQGSLNFAYQIEEEHALFQELFDRLGPARFFPELAGIGDAASQIAQGRVWFADALRLHRHWRRFALTQYRLCAQTHPTWQIRWKIVSCLTAIMLWGDEQEALTLGKQGRILLNLGQPQRARQLSGTLFLRHPLRWDALAVWLGSWIPRKVIDALRSLKRWVKP